MTSQLSIYNQALGLLEERQLASLTEGREPRRVLDSYWADVVAYALAQGLWKFAKRTAMMTASTTLVPSFGFLDAFPQPPDFVRVILVSTAPEMDPPLLQYSYEAGVFYANMTPMYLSYVSNDPNYGMNIAAWPEHFTDYVGIRLAQKACPRIAADKTLKFNLAKEEDRARRIAKAEESMDEPPGLPPVAIWARARRGAYGAGGLWTGGGGNGG